MNAKHVKVMITAAFLFSCQVGHNDLMAKELGIAIMKIDVGGDGDSDERLVTQIVNDLLVQNVELGLRAQRRAQIQLHKLEETGFVGDATPDQLRKVLRPGVEVVLSPTFRSGERGYVLRIKIFHLGVSGRTLEDEREIEISIVTAVMEPSADFREIESKVIMAAQQVSANVLRRLHGDLPRVLIWCIYPEDFEDGQLVSLGRKLTLELPFYTSNLAVGQITGGEDYELLGMKPIEYFRSCLQPQKMGDILDIHRIESGVYDYVISGEVNKLGKEFGVSFLVEAGNEEHVKPLLQSDMPTELSESTLSKLGTALRRSLDQLAGNLEKPRLEYRFWAYYGRFKDKQFQDAGGPSFFINLPGLTQKYPETGDVIEARKEINPRREPSGRSRSLGTICPGESFKILDVAVSSSGKLGEYVWVGMEDRLWPTGHRCGR